MFDKGAKVKAKLPPASPRVEHARKVLDESEWSIKREAYRMALANRNKSWAHRYLRQRNEEI